MRTEPSANLLDESLIVLSDVPDTLPRKAGKPVCKMTVRRWTIRGVGGVEPLESARIGAVIHTSREALDRYFCRVSEAKRRGHGPSAQGVADNTRSAQRAAAELAALGF